MAQRDLTAALQLLAQRAEYITQAGGAAIALRRDGRNEMMCHARAGASAPEVGALFSTEFGLSGESVRTAQPLRCNDAERDSRVNRDICRELGIASVMVMPIVNDDHVMGVFELFSGKPNAFGDRDLAALQRLSEMVGIAVKLASAAGAGPQSLKSAVPAAASVAIAQVERVFVESKIFSAPQLSPVVPAPAPAKEQKKKLWSALDGVSDGQPSSDDVSRVPQVLRGLRKCDACGFPVSPGRSFCVECEEKNWRGRGTVAPTKASPAPASNAGVSTVAISVAPSTPASSKLPKPAVQDLAQPSLSTFTLSAGIEPSRSWLSSNKYIVGAILAAAAVMAAWLFR